MAKKSDPATVLIKAAFGGLLLVVASFIAWTVLRPPTPLTWAGNFLDGRYIIQARDKSMNEGRKRVVDGVIEDTVRKVDLLFSRTPGQGMLGELNASTSTVATMIGVELWRALDLKLKLHGPSGGACDPTIAPFQDLWMNVAMGAIGKPTEADLRYLRGRTGVEKVLAPAEGYYRKLEGEVQLALDDVAHGYAADRLALLLEDHNVHSYFIDVRGAIRSANMLDMASAVPIAKPPGEGTHAPAVVNLGNGAMATVGRNDGRIHVDPRTGRPVSNGVHAVCVVAGTALEAAGLAETLFVMGPQAGLPWLDSTSPFRGKALFLMTKTNGALDKVFSAGFPLVP